MTETATRKYSDATWAAVRTVSRGAGHSWTELHDLEVELAGMAEHLADGQPSVLISAAQNGCPVTLTWDTYLGEEAGTERRTSTVIVESVTVWPATPDQNRVRISYWGGFNHDVLLSKVVDAVVPDSTVKYLR